MKPLSGVRVLEVANWIAAPGAGVMLSDLGAEVTKVEPPTGDSMRGKLSFPNVDGPAGEVDYVFQMENRGKRSLVIDLDDPDGVDEVQRMACDTDILLTNLLPRRQRQYGLDPETVFALTTGLVHATLTGYGTMGDKADNPGFDITAFFGHSGASSLVPGADGPPKFRNGQGDHTSSLAMFGAVMVGLRMRDQTGENQTVETSLMHTGAWTVGADMSDALVNGKQPKLRSRTEQINAIHSSYQDGEGDWFLVVMPNTEGNWRKVCAAIGRDDLPDDERFADGSKRYRNMTALVAELDAVFASKTRSEWGKLFGEAGVIWGPINDLPTAMSDPQMRAAEVFATVDHPSGAYETVTIPMRINGQQVAPASRAPEIGEHTEDVLGRDQR